MTFRVKRIYCECRCKICPTVFFVVSKIMLLHCDVYKKTKDRHLTLDFYISKVRPIVITAITIVIHRCRYIIIYRIIEFLEGTFIENPFSSRDFTWIFFV